MPSALNDYSSASAMRRLLGMAICAGGLVLSWGDSHAVNRCSDPDGKVTFQDSPCKATADVRPVDTSEAFSTKPSAPL